MIRITQKTIACALLTTALVFGQQSIIAGEPVTDVINRMATAMGGIDQLQSAHNQMEVAKIFGFAPLQAATPGGDPETFDRLQYTLTRALDNSRYRTHWLLDVDFPLQTMYDFQEIINADRGAVIGIDNLLQIPQAPMQAIRLAARKMQYFVTSPVEMVKAMLAAPRDVVLHGSDDSSRKNRVVVLELKRFNKNILLWVDARTYLPVKATYWDSNPSFGDREIVTRYSDWQTFDGIEVPTLITQMDEDDLLLRIERQSVNFNVEFITDPYFIPAELSAPFDNKLFQIGLKYSQWFHRYLVIGIPFDLNQYTSESVFLDSIADGISYLRGLTHHSLIVEMADYLILFDPVLLEERTQLVLPIIKQRWPNKKIKYVVPTHFHVDHSGGLRGYVADGAKLIGIESNKRFYKEVLKAKHVLYPDILSVLDKKARLITLDDDEEFTLTDGKRRVRLLQIENRHAPGLIVPYIEDTKMIFVSDLYSPGLLPVPMPPQFAFWSLDLYKDLQRRDLDIQTLVGAHGGVGSYQDFVNDVETTFPTETLNSQE